MQDVYRCLAAPKAMNGLLRVRTSPEFRVVRGFGQLTADKTYDNLYYIVACDSSATFAFDFEYTDGREFSEQRSEAPYVQIAFQYDTRRQTSHADRQEQLGNGATDQIPTQK